MSASYPASTPSFGGDVTNNQDYVDASHINRLREELIAIAANLRAAFPAATAAIGGQLKFPATQAASSDPNTLDHYVEGTFTPALKFGGNSTGLTYTTQEGAYVKVGQMVTVTIRLVLSAKGSSTGSATITGLPFALAAFYGGLTVHYFDNLNSAVSDVKAYIGSSGTTVNLVTVAAAGGTAVVNMANTTVTNTTTLILSGTYRAGA